MTKLEGAIFRTLSAKQKYHNELYKAEEIYKEKFGKKPSEMDDDMWIDVIHGRKIISPNELVKQSTRHNMKK